MPKPITSIGLDHIGMGLNTRDRSTKIPHGVATKCENVSLHRGNLKTFPGHTRVTNNSPRQGAMLFDGKRYLRSDDVTGGQLDLSTSGQWAVECVIRIDAISDQMAVIHKGKGGAKGIGAVLGTDYDWDLRVLMNQGQLQIVWTLTNGTGAGLQAIIASSVTTAGSAPLEIGKSYVVSMVGGFGNWLLYVFEPGEDAGTALSLTRVAGYPATNYDRIYVGAHPITKSLVDDLDEHSTLNFSGIIQEIRVWTSAPSQSTVTTNGSKQIADTATSIGWFLTGSSGSNGKTFTDDTGVGVDLVVEPANATWATGLVDQTKSSLCFNGDSNGFVVRDSYLYRSSDLDEDGVRIAHQDWWIAATVRVDSLRDNAVILHWTHANKGDYTNTFIDVGSTMKGVTSPGSSEEAQWQLELAADGTHANTYEFRFVVFLDDPALTAPTTRAYSVSSILSTGASTGGVQEDTVYHVMVSFKYTPIQSSVNGEFDLKMWVDGTNSGQTFSDDFLQQSTASSTAGNDFVMLGTDDDPPGSASKYLMTMGTAIEKARKGHNNEADPNDIDWKPKQENSFVGCVDQIVIGSGTLTSTSTDSFLGVFLKDNYLDRNKVHGMTTSIIKSAWLLNEGAGGVAEDIGQVGNDLSFTVDPSFVRGNSLIETVARGKIYGIIDHRYRSPTGEVRKPLAITDGGVASIDEVTDTLVHMSDGLRNDNVRRAGLSRWRDSVVVCTGDNPNMMIWKDQMYRLSIEPPTGFIPFGVEDQINDTAKLQPGRYLYGFTFYSSFQNKRSPLGSQVVVNLKWDGNVVFGEDAEILQTRAKTVRSDKGPFDLAGKKSWLKLQAWLEGSTSGDPEGGPKASPEDPDFKKVKFTSKSGLTKPGVAEKDSVDVSEIKSLVELRADRCFVETFSEDSLEIRSRFLGSESKLYVDNAGGSGSFDAISVIWKAFVTSTSPSPVELTIANNGVIQGTGVTGHGLKLPVSDDPQVTHLEIWRSLADGTDLRLISRVPNGTETFKDNVPDELNIGEVLDRSAGVVPPTKHVVSFGARRLYFGDPLQPQRMYISNTNEPWNVPAGNVVDFLDGNTLELRMAIGSEDNVILCKDDTTFVLVPSTNPAIPFQIFTRFRDSGCVAPYGVAEVSGVAMYPDEQGFVAYDTTRPAYIGRSVEDDWRSLNDSTKDLTQAVHHVDKECVGFSVVTGDTLVDGAMVQDQIWWYFYKTGFGADGKLYGWTKQTGVNAATMAVVADVNERDRVWWGDSQGYIYQHDTGTPYGPAEVTDRELVIQSGTNNTTTITVPQVRSLVTLPEGHRGFFVTIVDASDSTGKTRETRLVTADDLASPSVLTLDHALTTFTPEVGDTVLVGSVESVWETGEMAVFGPDREGKLLNTHITMKKQVLENNLAFKWKSRRGNSGNSDVFSEKTISNFSEDAHIGHRENGHGRRVVMGIECRGPDSTFEVDSITLDINPTGKGQKET